MNKVSGMGADKRSMTLSLRMGALATGMLLAFAAQAQVAMETAALAKGGAGGAKAVEKAPVKAPARMPGNVAVVDAAPASVAGAASTVNLTCAGDLPAPVGLNVTVGKSTLLKLSTPIVRRTLGNEGVVQAKQLGPQTLYLLGIKVGSTNMILQDKTGKCALVDVDVGIDPIGVRNKLMQVMPDEKAIQVSSAAGTLMLAGEVSDAYKAERAVAIATAYAGGGQAQKVINMLTVAAPQQVMLEVQVAEVAKNLLDKLNGAVSSSQEAGKWTHGIVSNHLAGIAGTFTSKYAAGAWLALEAEKKDGMVKILAEPTIMAISGHEGAFLAGGKIFIPVSSSSANGVVTISLEEREFGVGLKFTPTVLEGGLINLKVAPEVSELASEGVSISATGSSNAAVLPVITTRRAATTVQLYDGQSFAIGGLIKNNVTQNMAAFPLLGEIPVLGALFRSSSFQADRSELLIVVTPRLVKPLPTNYRLPTDGFVPPSRSEFFLGGKMEASPSSKDGADKPSSFVPDTVHAAPASGPSGFEVR